MCEFFKQQIFPGFYASYVNKKLKKQLDEENEFDVNVSSITGNKDRCIKEVKDDLVNQLDRKKRRVCSKKCVKDNK